LDQENDNPAVIEIANSVDFKICYETNAEWKALGKLTVDIPAEIFDAIAIAWCQKRSLDVALGGPIRGKTGEVRIVTGIS